MSDVVTLAVPLPQDVAAKRARSWLDYRPKLYQQLAPRWRYTHDLYTGECVDPARIATYLVRRESAESAKAYAERCRLADYPMHLATVVDSLVGMLAAVDLNATRVWANDSGRGLGDPTDPKSRSAELWDDADGQGNGYLTLWKLLSVDLVLFRRAWVLVDSVGSRTVLRILPPAAVVNWVHGPDGALIDALVEEEVDSRQRLEDEPATRTRYVRFRTDGWQRYDVSDNGDPVPLVGAGNEGTYTYVNPSTGVQELPLFPVELPLRRDVGYLLARRAFALFNQESARDNLLRVANFVRLVLAAGDTLFTKLSSSLAEGSNVLQEDPDHAGGGHRYIAPDTGPATVATAVLDAKVRDFYVNGFREYGDAAAERTATEVRQDVASGVGAFLQLLKAAVDGAENGALWRLEQALLPNDRSAHGIARVERSDDFLPADPETVLERRAALVFGKDKPVPLGKAGRLAVAREVAAYQGIEVDDAELEAAVEVQGLLDILAQSMDLVLPAEVRAELTVKALAAAGLIDASREVAMADGTKAKLGDLVRSQAVELAQAADDAKRREAELLTGGGPDDVDDTDPDD